VNSAVEALAFSPDGRYLATGCRDSLCQIWNVARGTLHRSLKAHTGPITSVAFRPDGKRLVTASSDRTIRVWNVSTGRKMQRLAGHMDTIYSAVYSQDGQHLFSAGADCTLRIWDPHTGLQERQLPSHAEQVFALAASPDGVHIISAGENGTAQIWNIGPSGSRELFTFVPGGHIYSLAFSPDGSTLAVGTHRKEIELIDIPSGKRQTLSRGHSTQVEAVVFTPDGQMLVSGGRDGKIVLWDLPAGTRRRAWTAGKQVWSLAVAPDGQRLLSGSSDGILREWQIANEGSPFELLRPEGVARGAMAMAAAYHPGGSHAAAGYGDGSLVVWSLEQAIPVALFSGLHNDCVQEVAFSPDGRILISIGQDGVVHLLSVDAQVTQISPYARRQHHAGALFALAVAANPQGLCFATGGVDRITRVWAIPAGEELLALHGHTDRIYALAFSPDGQTLATAGRDGTLRGYTLNPSELVSLSRSRLTRELSDEEYQMYFGRGKPHQLFTNTSA
jgi:WD40 repeat protein